MSKELSTAILDSRAEMSIFEGLRKQLAGLFNLVALEHWNLLVDDHEVKRNGVSHALDTKTPNNNSHGQATIAAITMGPIRKHHETPYALWLNSEANGGQQEPVWRVKNVNLSLRKYCS